MLSKNKLEEGRPMLLYREDGGHFHRRTDMKYKCILLFEIKKWGAANRIVALNDWAKAQPFFFL